MSLERLPGPVARWTAERGPEWSRRWELVLRRASCEAHATDIHAFTVNRLFNQRLRTTVWRNAAILCRLSAVMGTRPLIDTTTADLEALLNAPHFPRYHKFRAVAGSTTPNNSRLRHDMAEVVRLFLRFLRVEAGMDEKAAREKVQELFDAAQYGPLGDPRRQDPLRLTASDIAKIFGAIPEMLLPRAEAVQLTLWLSLLVAQGPRAAGCLRSRVADVSWIDGLACISVPPGYRQKHTRPLFLDKVASALLQAYLDWHPGRANGEAPLFIHCRNDGAIVPQTSYDLGLLLDRIGGKVGFRRRLGVRSFRKFMATRAVVDGATQEDLRRRLAHGNRSTSTGVYIQLTRAEVVEVVRRLRAGHVGPFSPCCGFRYRPGDTTCAQCGRPTGDGQPAATVADAAQARRDAAGRFGLECISDLEAEHAQ